MQKHSFFRAMVLCIMAVLIVTASGCKDGEDAPPDNRQVVELPTDNVLAYCVSPEGPIYFSLKGGDKIYCCDSKGSINEEIELGSGDYTSLCMWEDKLYVLDYVDSSLIEIDLLEESFAKVEINGALNFAGSMVAMDSFIYFVVHGGRNNELEEISYNNDNNYAYGGERFIKLNLENGEITDLNMPFVKLITAGEDKELHIYAYDTERGFYFAAFDTEDDSEGTRYYANNNNLVLSFAYDSKREGYFYFDRDECVFAEARNPEVQTRFYSCKYAEEEVMPQNGNDIQIVGRYMYLLNNRTGSGAITRLLTDSYIKDTKEIVIYSTTMVEAPDGLGYSVRKEYLDTDDLAMKLMAGDSEYDILIIPTGTSILESMFAQGAYATLSGEGIDNYFSEVRAPIKKAATTEDGYWMLPIQIWPTAVLYREDMCKNAGLDMGAVDSIDSLFDLRNRLLAYEASPRYHTNFFAISNAMIYRILYSYHTYGIEASKEEFRRTAQVLENYYQKDLEGTAVVFSSFGYQLNEENGEMLAAEIDGNGLYGNVDRMLTDIAKRKKEYYDSVYYVVVNSKYDYRDVYLLNGGFSARELPPIAAEAETVTAIEAEVMVVNPNTSEPETVIAYLNELAAVLIDDPSTFLSATALPTETMDKQFYGDLGGILDKGELFINAPVNLVGDSMFAYLRKELSLDDAIEDYTRAISAYYEE